MSDLSAVLSSGLLGLETPVQSISPALDQYFSADRTRTRAALINFAIFSDAPESLPELDAQLQHITHDHACRALLIAAGSSLDTTQIQAWIKGLCHLDGAGGKFRCSEQVSFLVRGRSEGVLTNLVFSNLRSDLPLVVWWQASLQPHFHERLYSRIDRLIFDSSRWQNPRSQFALIRQALARTNKFHSKLLLHDLAYTRGHEHRRAIALLFDDPVAQQQVPFLNRLEVSYRTGHRHSALYLGAWLSRQLGAVSPRPIGPDAFEFTRATGTFALCLHEQKEGNAPVLPSLKLSGPEATFSVLPSPAGLHLETRAICGGLQKELLCPASQKPDEGLVSDILMRSGSNLLLTRVLPRFLELLEL